MEAKNNFIAGEENILVAGSGVVDWSCAFSFVLGKEGGVLTDWNKLVRDLATLLGAGVIHDLITGVAVSAVTS